MNNSEKTPHFRSYLYTSFARDYNEEQVGCLMSKFDTMCDAAGGPEAAFVVALETYGNEDVMTAHATVTKYIENELRKQVAGKTVSTEGRLKDLIARFNKSIDALSDLTIDGKSLDENEKEKIKIHMPYASRETHTATASEKHPNKKVRAAKSLSLEICYF